MNPAYVAGLVDGEGCITIEATQERFYYPRLYIGMTEKALPILEAIKKEWGGSLKMIRAETDCWCAAWMYCLMGVPLIPLLAAMEPYLILKASQCKLALELGTLIASRKGCRKGDLWTNELTLAAREIQTKMKRLNRKGPMEN